MMQMRLAFDTMIVRKTSAWQWTPPDYDALGGITARPKHVDARTTGTHRFIFTLFLKEAY